MAQQLLLKTHPAVQSTVSRGDGVAVPRAQNRAGKAPCPGHARVCMQPAQPASAIVVVRTREGEVRLEVQVGLVRASFNQYSRHRQFRMLA